MWTTYKVLNFFLNAFKTLWHGAKIFGAHDLDDGWRYGASANRAPIGNDYWELNGHVNGDVP